jgi:hypothetical protein
MCNLPNTDPHEGEIGWRIRTHAIDIFSGLTIEFRLDNLILVTAPQGFLKAGKSINVTHCSAYLESRAIERVHGRHYQDEPPALQSERDSSAT